MSNNIIIINGPNLNLLGKREQSQYGSITFKKLKENCLSKAKDLNIDLEFSHSNIEGEIVTTIQEAKVKAYKMIEEINWKDGFYRKDIGWRAL